ncbi:MAG: hypothetical protein V4719_00245 [Planctomycetota bacterium]
MMGVDREARTRLREAVISYMSGEISTFAFDDINTACGSQFDTSLQQISRVLFLLHDDFDHPISVTFKNWMMLQRIVAFLSTNLEIESPGANATWPFGSTVALGAAESTMGDAAIPTYDVAIHCCQVHPWWNRIPSHVGYIILSGILLAIIFALIRS